MAVSGLDPEVAALFTFPSLSLCALHAVRRALCVRATGAYCCTDEQGFGAGALHRC